MSVDAISKRNNQSSLERPADLPSRRQENNFRMTFNYPVNRSFLVDYTILCDDHRYWHTKIHDFFLPFIAIGYVAVNDPEKVQSQLTFLHRLFFLCVQSGISNRFRRLFHLHCIQIYHR